MSEPSGKRFKSNLPVCKTHRLFVGSRVKQNLPASVEESLCGVVTLLLEVAYRLEALGKIFEQDNLALPRVAAFFQQAAAGEQEQAERMLQYLCERGGQYCNKDIKRPGCETVQGLLSALELSLSQWKEEMAVLVDLIRLAREHGDAHSASVVKGRFLRPLVSKVKMLGDLVTNARRVGCTVEGSAGYGEYLMDQLQDELAGGY